MLKFVGTGVDSKGRKFEVCIDRLEVRWGYVGLESFVSAFASCKSILPYLTEYVLRHGGEFLQEVAMVDGLFCPWDEELAKLDSMFTDALRPHGAWRASTYGLLCAPFSEK